MHKRCKFVYVCMYVCIFFSILLSVLHHPEVTLHTIMCLAIRTCLWVGDAGSACALGAGQCIPFTLHPSSTTKRKTREGYISTWNLANKQTRTNNQMFKIIYEIHELNRL